MRMVRIAMWSGPRNISTAMMRSWENREDTFVVDEPLYGPYLAQTGKQHPCYQEVINAQGAEYEPILDKLTQGHSSTNHIFYQKHMTHHILPEMDLTWVKSLKNAFLIRHPAEVISSYLEKHHNPSPEDLGYPQQLKLFNLLKNNSENTPLVFESKDVLMNPKKMLQLMCKKLGVPFKLSMLSWPKGYRESDGVWSSHWYNRVIETTGFATYQAKEIHLNLKQKKVVKDCLPYYEEIQRYKI